MVSYSGSAENSVGGLFGEVRANGFSNTEWLPLVDVDSKRFAASCRGGSAGLEFDAVSSCCDCWVVLSTMSINATSNNLLAFV